MRGGYSAATLLNAAGPLAPGAIASRFAAMKPGALSLILVFALAAAPAAAADPPSLGQRVEARLAEAGSGLRFGLVVATEDGRELIAIAPDSRFIPASNTKMFTTAAAFAALPGLDRPDSEGGAAVRLEAAGRGAPDVVLEGRGDARLSSAPDCVRDCLADARRRGRRADPDGPPRGRRRQPVPGPALEPGDELEQHPDPLGHRGLGAQPRRQRAAAPGRTRPRRASRRGSRCCPITASTIAR